MSDTVKSPKQWTGNQRRDGLTVLQATEGWIIRTASGHVASLCPCCDRTMREDWAARRVADFVFPVEAE